MTDPQPVATTVTTTTEDTEVVTQVDLEEFPDPGMLLPLKGRRLVYLIGLVAGAVWFGLEQAYDFEPWVSACYAGFTVGANALALGNTGR